MITAYDSNTVLGAMIGRAAFAFCTVRLRLLKDPDHDETI